MQVVRLASPGLAVPLPRSCLRVPAVFVHCQIHPEELRRDAHRDARLQSGRDARLLPATAAPEGGRQAHRLADLARNPRDRHRDPHLPAAGKVLASQRLGEPGMGQGSR